MHIYTERQMDGRHCEPVKKKEKETQIKQKQKDRQSKRENTPVPIQLLAKNFLSEKFVRLNYGEKYFIIFHLVETESE